MFNVGGGRDFSTSVKEVINLLESKYEKFVDVKYVDQQRRADQIVYISDNRKVCKEFDWAPTVTLEQGYKEIFNWVDNNVEKLKELYQ